MTHEALTPTETVAAKALADHWNAHVDTSSEMEPQAFAGDARAVVAAISAVPDVNEMNRGFGNCPHCRSPLVAHCHECLNDIERDAAHAAGWRMDHLSGFGCIALCPDCRNDKETANAAT